MADRVFRRLRSIFRFALAHDLIGNDPTHPLKPAEIFRPRKVEHPATLSERDAPTFLIGWRNCHCGSTPNLRSGPAAAPGGGEGQILLTFAPDFDGVGSSAERLLANAAPASVLISTGKMAPFSNRSCTRTLPRVSESETPAAKQSKAGGGSPGACSVFSSNAIATAGARSVEMTAFLSATCFVGLRLGAVRALPALRGRLATTGLAGFRTEVVMGRRRDGRPAAAGT